MFAKTFRNTLVASTLLVGASIIASSAALAADDPTSVTTDPYTVGGDVELINKVSFEPVLTSVALDGAAGQVDRKLGTLTIQNNHVNGWKLSVASTNGELRLDGTSTEHVLAYGGLQVADIGTASFTALGPTINDGEIANASFSPEVAAEETADLTADITTTEAVPAGVYSDTLTFTLTNN